MNCWWSTGGGKCLDLCQKIGQSGGKVNENDSYSHRNGKDFSIFLKIAIKY